MDTLANQFQYEVGIANVISHFMVKSWLTSTIFIANLFHTFAKVSSIIFNLCLQFFADAKIFELERLFTYKVFDTIFTIASPLYFQT